MEWRALARTLLFAPAVRKTAPVSPAAGLGPPAMTSRAAPQWLPRGACVRLDMGIAESCNP